MTSRLSPKPLAGWRVLVPRGGEWGNTVAASLRKQGALPVVAPMINFASSQNAEQLAEFFSRLEGGEYEWLIVTSSTTVDVLVGHNVRVPTQTRIAAIGEMTVPALTLAGYRIDFTPESDNSSRGLVKEWAVAPPSGRVLVPQSEGADESLATGLKSLSVLAEFVTAYRTVGVPVPRAVADDVASGAIGGILITSGSVARQIQEQLAPLPANTVIVAIGPRTAFEARAAGIAVNVIAEERTVEALVEGLIEGSIK